MTFIKNQDALARTDTRRDMLTLIEAAYTAIETEHVLRASITVSGTTLTIRPTHAMAHTNEATYDLSQYERIFIVGCGKVACRAAAILEDILGERVDGGAVIGLSENVCDVVSTYQGTHPLPSAINFAASTHIEKIGESVTDKDLVLALIGGGGSAMLCSTQGECDQGQRLYEAFLHSGGIIDELNIVRRHISSLKGGGLARVLYPATVVGLVFSDVPGGNPKTVASGPTYYDETHATDAQAIIDRYTLGSYVLNETPKEKKYFERVTNILLVSNETALHAIGHSARELGYEAVMPQCDPYAPPPDLIACMTEAARPRAVTIVGGEPRLAVPRDAHGRGGRCSHTALEALSAITEKQLFAAIASDGHDNDGVAGALVDDTTKKRFAEKGSDVDAFRRAYDSRTALEMTDDLLLSDPIEANVSDLFILLTS